MHSVQYCFQAALRVNLNRTCLPQQKSGLQATTQTPRLTNNHTQNDFLDKMPGLVNKKRRQRL